MPEPAPVMTATLPLMLVMRLLLRDGLVSGGVGRRAARAWWRSASRSNRRVSRRNTNVKPGQSVVLLPCSSRYQLAQPPVVQMVRFMCACRSALYALSSADVEGGETVPVHGVQRVDR